MKLTKAEFTIRPNTWVTIILAGFLAWALIIVAVVLFTVKAASIDPPQSEPRGQYPEIEQCDLPLWDRIRFKCPD
jgi:hypothetical protein